MTENLELREWIAVHVIGAKLVVKQSCLDSRSWSLYVSPPDGEPLAILKLPYGDTKPEAAWSENVAWYLPKYELTWDAAAMVVDAMCKKGLATRYAEELGKIVPGACAGELRWSGVARMLLATPMQQCLAAKAAIEGEG